MSKTVLVVEDEMLIALDLEMQLGELGHRTVVASNVPEAVAALERSAIDVAILDWHLKGSVSAPIVEMLNERQIPFVICSASALEELRGLFPSVMVVPKPYERGILIGALFKAMGDEESDHPMRH